MSSVDFSEQRYSDDLVQAMDPPQKNKGTGNKVKGCKYPLLMNELKVTVCLSARKQ